MKMTPLDIRQKRFEVSLRGYDRREVEGFLELTAGEFEEVVKENIGLKEELKRVQARLEQHLEREKALQETMVTAQRISEDVKSQARKEAEVIVAEAELQAEKIIAQADRLDRRAQRAEAAEGAVRVAAGVGDRLAQEAARDVQGRGPARAVVPGEAQGDRRRVSGWLSEVAGGAQLLVVVQPRASRTRIVGEHDGRLKLQLAAPPVDGEANQALIAFLAELFEVRKSAIRLVDGETSKKKRILLEGVAAERARLVISSLL
jgi:uncharacterized protein (TIGR00251 family)